jgi:hypothetical protein
MLNDLNSTLSASIKDRRWKDARSRDVWTEKQQDQDAIHQAMSPPYILRFLILLLMQSMACLVIRALV